MEHLNKILFLAVCGGAFVYYHIKNEGARRYEELVTSLAESYSRDATSARAVDSAMIANYMRTLVALDDFRLRREEAGIEQSDRDFLHDSLARAGYTSDTEIYAAAGGIMENLSICARLGILEDPEQKQRMSDGLLPIARTGPYKGEKLVFERRVSVEFARGAANHPANLRLAPESAAAMIWPYTVTDYMLKAANDLRAAALITDHEMSDIRRRNTERRAMDIR